MRTHTTIKELKRLALYGDCKDITRLKFEEVCTLREQENGFNVIATSLGMYGLNGALLEGYNSKQMYVITARSSVLAQLV